jgi:hypothetical protein
MGGLIALQAHPAKRRGEPIRTVPSATAKVAATKIQPFECDIAAWIRPPEFLQLEAQCGKKLLYNLTLIQIA